MMDSTGVFLLILVAVCVLTIILVAVGGCIGNKLLGEQRRPLVRPVPMPDPDRPRQEEDRAIPIIQVVASDPFKSDDVSSTCLVILPESFAYPNSSDTVQYSLAVRLQQQGSRSPLRTTNF